jgi:hypothetical protein
MSAVSGTPGREGAHDVASSSSAAGMATMLGASCVSARDGTSRKPKREAMPEDSTPAGAAKTPPRCFANDDGFITLRPNNV